MLSETELEDMRATAETTMILTCDIIRQVKQNKASGIKIIDNVLASNVKCNLRSYERRTITGEIINSPVQFKVLLPVDQTITFNDIIKIDNRKFNVVEIKENNYKISKSVICEEAN